MKLRVFQKGFNYSQDGPGNRLVLHLAGCNMRCPWCSNPEGLDASSGELCDVEELAGEIQRSSLLFFDGGGVTLTGGEFSMQFPAAEELLRSVHDAGVDTCVETNGTSRRLPELFPVLDHLIVDLKHYEGGILKSVCGAGLENTLENLGQAVRSEKDVLIRIPLIGGFNASPEDAHQFVLLLERADIPKSVPVELLKYHEYGKDKYAKLGMPYTMTDKAFVPAEAFHAFSETLASSGIRLIKT